MMEARKKRSQQNIQDAMIVKKKQQRTKTWKGLKLTSSMDVSNEDIQGDLELVMVGSDVKAL